MGRVKPKMDKIISKIPHDLNIFCEPFVDMFSKRQGIENLIFINLDLSKWSLVKYLTY